MSRFRLRLAVCALMLFAGTAYAEETRTVTFHNPADALSVAFASKDSTADVSALIDGTWTAWQALSVEDEQDPALTESNLIVFPAQTTQVRFRGDTDVTVHPIRVSGAPIHYNVAATTLVGAPRILSRQDWSADESLTIRAERPSSGASPATGSDDSGPALSVREQQCEQWQLDYPQDFHTPPATTRNADGNLLRWPHTYSTEIKLLVVHHTAQSLQKESRSGVELVRALYQYHAQNRGWGDIGYHYVIDQEGKIYEGKSGGDFVVGGHVYCNNVGTIGVALIGNFDEDAPPQTQARALQSLLASLGDRYKIDLDGSVAYHGITRPPVVAHRDLLQTACPGSILYAALGQIRTHVAQGNTQATVSFSVPSQRVTTTKPSTKTVATQPAGFSALGATALEGRPGGDIVIPVLFRAGKTYRQNMTVGSAKRSTPSLQLWQDKEGAYVPLRSAVTTPLALHTNESVMLRVKVRLPRQAGAYTLSLGDVTYTLASTGRRVRVPQITSSGDTSLVEIASAAEPAARNRSSSSSLSPRARTDDALIRIRLSVPSAPSVTIRLAGGGGEFSAADVTLSIAGSRCLATQGSKTAGGTQLRLSPSSGMFTIASWQKAFNRFRGTLECHVIDGQMVLINELPLEDYLLGLAEEPDTEPPEKQKAFAVAARTYALWYLDPTHRKFPGKPYDGSDSPAEFQVYAGAAYEDQNPLWINAVRSTARQTLTYEGQLIKPPYFSSDDGRTRSPAEAGWGKTFPFAEIFASKPDPWCQGMPLRGHGVGMSGCGAEAQANEGKSYREILQYYYPGTTITP